MSRYIICDIDGTIADLSHRLKYIKPDHPDFPGKKDWAAFHDSVLEDGVHEDIRAILWPLVGEYPDNRTVLYVSGRMERSRHDTRRWLRLNMFPEGDLFMRADGDFRADDIVKEEIIDRLGIKPADVLCVLDDRDRVVAMWRRKGFRCLQVAPGEF